MKEIHELHAKILALQSTPPAEHPVNFSRVEIEDADALLSDELLDELKNLQGQINPCLPDDVDYFAFVGGAQPPIFNLVLDDFPTSIPRDTLLAQDQPLIPQLTALDWDQLRSEASVQQDQFLTFSRMMAAATRAPRSTKAVQRDFKEDAKVFIREKRTDASKIHVLWYGVDDDKLLVEGCATADELRRVLPRVLFGGGEVITIVAYGKPLPVEKIDALMYEAHRKTGPMLDEVLAKAERGTPPADGIIEVESSVSDEAEPAQT